MTGYNDACPASLLMVSSTFAGIFFSRKEEYVGPFTLKAGNRVRIGNDTVLRVDKIKPLKLSIIEGSGEITMHRTRKNGEMLGTLKYNNHHPISVSVIVNGNLALICFRNVPDKIAIRTMPKEILRSRQPQSV